MCVQSQVSRFTYQRETWLLMHNSDDPELQTAAVRVYIDESGGDDPSTPHAVIGGMLITRRQFDVFEEAWDAMLADHHLFPALHMKEFGRPHGRFAAMSDCHRHELMQEVANLIKTSRLGTLSVSITNEEFKKRLPLEAREKFGVYGMCFLWAVMIVHLVSRNGNYQQRIPFILDAGNPYANHVRGAHATILEMQRGGKFLHMGGLLFEDDEQFGTLQAADVIAWAARRRASVYRLSYPFDPLNDLFENTPHHSEASWQPEWLTQLGNSLSKYISKPSI